MAVTVTVSHDEPDTPSRIRVIRFSTENGDAIEEETILEYGDQRTFMVDPIQSLGIEECGPE